VGREDLRRPLLNCRNRPPQRPERYHREKIVGKAFGELDPNDPKNAVIVDIQLAPKNANGRVEYAFDFYILKPIDLSKGPLKDVPQESLEEIDFGRPWMPATPIAPVTKIRSGFILMNSDAIA
jgi:hypothetical protein